jgi:hypothetical protein
MAKKMCLEGNDRLETFGTPVGEMKQEVALLPA